MANAKQQEAPLTLLALQASARLEGIASGSIRRAAAHDHFGRNSQSDGPALG
jgi:hypothetical protein